MSKLIKLLRSNRQVIFDRGKFDNWCVYIVEKNGKKIAPLDAEYFADLKSIAGKYEGDKVYNDFVAIYNRTTKLIDKSILDLIDEIVETYTDEDKSIIEQWFAVIYAGMIAEENKEHAILKKRIKRLGIHQTLKLGCDPKIASNFSKGKKWRDLDAIMKPLGF